MSHRKREEPFPKSIETHRRRNDMVTSYLIAYLLPFLGLNYSTYEGWIVMGVFFTMLAIIQIRSEQLYVNPVLAMFGYNVFEVVDAESGNTDLLVVDRNKQLSEDTYPAVQIGPDVYLTVDG
jgi:hypothetical protein